MKKETKFYWLVDADGFAISNIGSEDIGTPEEALQLLLETFPEYDADVSDIELRDKNGDRL
jgi:hypothetical protein